MHKKGQITVFMALGIVILFIFGSALVMIPETQISYPTDIMPIKNYIDLCMQQVGDRALERVLIQGGTYEQGTLLSNPRIYKLAAPIPSDGQYAITYTSHTFSRHSIEESTENFFKDAFSTCSNDFSVFPYQIEKGEFSVDSKVLDQSIVYTVSYPLTIHLGETTYDLSTFRYAKKAPLREMQNVVNGLVVESIANDFFPKDEVLDLLSDEPISMKVNVVDDGNRAENVIYLLGFEQNKYFTAFAIHYDYGAIA